MSSLGIKPRVAQVKSLLNRAMDLSAIQTPSILTLR